MRKALLGVAFALWLTPAAHAAAASQRILFVSNRSGPTQIYAADPSGKAPVGQLTFASAQTCDFPRACGVKRPIPSPDGRHLLFATEYSVYRDGYRSNAYALWTARADGTAIRRVSPLDQETQEIGAVAWARDSTKFAYAILDRPHAVHVARADGSADRVVRRFEGSSAIGWSRDSRRLLFVDATLSPDGRWNILRTQGGLFVVVRTAASKTWSIPESTWGSPAWSPDSRLLAYARFPRGIAVLDVRTGRIRQLTSDSGVDLAWAPDGRSLAYRAVPTLEGSVLEPLDTSGAGSDLRTTTLSGHVQVVVAHDGPYGGAVSFAWTRVKSLSYRAPQQVDGFYTRSIVQRLAADGSRFAYATCVEAGVLSVASQVPITFGQLRCSGSGPLVGTLAVSGGRVAYTTIAGGNITSWSVEGVVLEPALQRFTIERGGETCCVARPAVAGAGDLLVYSTRRWIDGQTLEWQVRAIGATGCECRFVTAFAKNYREPLGVEADGGRVLVKGRGWVEVFTRQGDALVLLDGIPAAPAVFALDPTTDATLSGDDVIVRVDDKLQAYDINGHTWESTWPTLGLRPMLQDASRGRVAYTAEGDIHVLSLADGSDRIVAHGTLARFMDDGLVYADGARIRLIPFSSLP